MDIENGYEAFIESVDRGLTRYGIARTEIAMMDHLCYRVETDERYREVYRKLGERATMIGEVEVSGRPIATFELDRPLEAAGWVVPYIEIPAPKPGSPYKEGLEHAELVVIGDVTKFAARHADLEFDYKGMHKTINPELVLRTDDLSVKFHEQSLGAVVRIEQRLNKSAG